MPNRTDSARRRRSGKAAPKRRGGRWRRRLLRLVLALLVVWLIACFLIVREPTVNKPAMVDAVLVLGPPEVDGRLQLAEHLMAERLAGTLVVSIQSPKQHDARVLCQAPPAGLKLICFAPDPATTRGEAEEIGRLAKLHGWKSIMVVTSIYHVSRARLIVSRCMPGRVLMIAAPGKPSVAQWAYQFGYQTAGYIKALTHTSC